jgi:hypothetical protein
MSFPKLNTSHGSISAASMAQFEPTGEYIYQLIYLSVIDRYFSELIQRSVAIGKPIIFVST